MAELASSIATTIFDHSVGAIVRECGYLWNYRKNIENLKKEVDSLDCVITDISHSVIVAERNTERVRSQVSKWQNNTKEIRAAATKIIEKYEENGRKRCLIGLCPNLVSLYQSSRKASKKQIEIDQARTEAAQFNGVADRAVRQVPAALSTKGYLTFDSRKSTLEEIMKTIKEDSKNSIGVYGLGGMGKTTLVKQVASRAAERKMFDEIVLAQVTQIPELKEIQGQIAKTLDLKLKESSIAERAGCIYERLKDKKVLVILDDLWKVLDLEKLGVPFGAEHKGCKILLTSRFQHVLSSMDTKKDFPLGALVEEEAWSLFEEKTIDVVKDPAFLDIGKKVAKRCEGLPVLIVTVAASLSKRPSLPIWKDTLKQLKQMNNKEMHEIVNSAMEFISYEHLEKTHKQLFLLCGLIGSCVSIADLLKYTLGWDLFDEDLTIEEARNKIDALILDLKASCLLLDDDDEDNVKIPDVVRDVAISIARKNLNMFSVGDNDTESNRWPKDDVLRTCTALVLHTPPNLSSLPIRLECPLLELLILSGLHLDSATTIPDTFFERTRKLKVLDMSSSSFLGLPSSLSFLENLQTLQLKCCQLKDISVLGGLKKLQVLSFVSSYIEELPRGIGHLSELRLLDLSGCFKLKVIPAGLIASLSRLEELYMNRSFNRWEVKECHGSSGISNASLAELNDLPNLRTLEIAVPDAKLLPEDVNFEKLDRYAITLGEISWWALERGNPKKGISRKIGMQLGNTSINHLQHGVKNLLERTEILCLLELKNIKNVINELHRYGFPELKHLRIQKGYDIQYIVNMEPKQHRFFPALMSLHLSDMLKLEKICNGQFMAESFCKLTIVKVQNCNKLVNLFSFSMAMGLPCLQEIEVSYCNTLEEVVAKKNLEDDVSTNDAVSEKIEFVQLRKLSLECLPQRRNIYSSVKTRQRFLTSDVQYEEISPEEEKQSFSMPFFKEVSFPRLEELTLSDISCLTEIWNDKLPEKSYCNLKSLVVKKCMHLVKVFSSNLLQLFRSLEVLRVRQCDLIEVVFTVPDELDIDEEHNGLVPQLIQLTLVDLPKLRCFWSKYHPSILSFKNLQTMTVEKCVSLKYLFTPSITMGLVRLQELRIESCLMMKEIIAKEEGETTIDIVIFPQLRYLYLEDLPNLTTFYSGVEEMFSNDNICSVIEPTFNEKVNFPNLERMSVGKCGNLKYLFTPSCAMGLLQLQTLMVKNCVMMKEVVVKGETTTDAIIFPHLSSLQLEDLPNLKTFHSGVENMDSKEAVCIAVQPPFNEKANFPSLEHMSVEKCGSLKYLFTPFSAMGLVRLQTLTVKDCVMMKKIVVTEGETTTNAIVFPQLSSLRLEDLPNLIRFYSGIEKLVSNENIHTEIQPFFNEKAKFPGLEILIVHKCDSLKYLFTPCITTSLVRVQQMTVKSCVMMKEIIAKEGETTIDTIIFPELSFLCLEDLPNLTRFCFESSIACQSAVSDDMTMNQGVGEMEPNKNLDAVMLSLFDEKAYFPKLERLTIKNLDNIKTIWHTQFHEDSFCKLTSLTVRKCANLLTTFPSTMLRKIRSLEKLRIVDCDTLEEVFEIQKGLNMKEIKDDVAIVMQLNDLFLKNLPNLGYVWEKDPLDGLNFQNLHQVQVLKCQSLKHVFPTSVTQCLHQLEMLSIQDCKGVETIVVDDEESEELVEEIKAEAFTFMFLKLAKFRLIKLPKLDCFYTREHTMEWPVLKDLAVYDCAELCAMDFLSFPKKCGENQFEKIVSNLDFLSITRKDMLMIMRQNDHFSSEFFRNLKRSIITDFLDESAVFPSKFFHRFRNLQRLSVYNCSFQEIFPHEGEVPVLVTKQEAKQTDNTILLSQITELKFYKLPELKYIWREDSPLIPILEKLKSLEVWECPRLTNLVPLSVSFKPLTKLHIRDCVGLINLIHYSTARSLEQLTELKITRCKMIEEIMVSERDESEDEIVFGKLRFLDIEDLPRLTNFCTGNYTFKFPSLTLVIVSGCSNMKTFCGGTTSTPKLERVYLTKSRDEERWKGDLNTTIQQLFSEMEIRRLTTTDPNTSSNSHFEPEALIHEKSTESAGREVEEICEELTETGNAEFCENVIKPREEVGIFEQCNDPRKGTEICEEVMHGGKEVDNFGKVAIAGKVDDTCENYVDERGKKVEIYMKATKPGNAAETCENVNKTLKEIGICKNAKEPSEGVDEIFDKWSETSKGTEVCEAVTERGKEIDFCGEVTEVGKMADMSEKGKGKGKEFESCEEVVDPAENGDENWRILSNRSFRTMPFNELGESSLPKEQQSEKSRRLLVIQIIFLLSKKRELAE